MLHRDWDLYDTRHVVYRPRGMTARAAGGRVLAGVPRLLHVGLHLARRGDQAGARRPAAAPRVRGRLEEVRAAVGRADPLRPGAARAAAAGGGVGQFREAQTTAPSASWTAGERGVAFGHRFRRWAAMSDGTYDYVDRRCRPGRLRAGEPALRSTRPCGSRSSRPAGPKQGQEIHIPAAFSKLFDARYDWNYHHRRSRTSPTVSCTGRAARRSAASTSINAMMWVRGPPGRLRRLGQCPGWSYEEVLPYFHRVEHRTGPTSVLRQRRSTVDRGAALDPNPAQPSRSWPPAPSRVCARWTSSTSPTIPASP